MPSPWRNASEEYFQTTVNRGTPEARDQRVAELIASGFEVVRYYENAVESRGSRTGLINGRTTIKHAYDGGSSRATYGAVLRKLKT